jgi:hypothetical protein
VADKKRKFRESDMVGVDESASSHASGRLAVKMPAGMSQFVPKAGQSYKIRMVPHRVGSHGKFQKGRLAYEFTYFSHPRLGPNNATVVCPAATWPGEKCYVCERRAKMGWKPDRSKEEINSIKALKPKQRQLFLLVDLKQSNKGLQFWEESYHKNFGSYLEAKINNSPEESVRRRRKLFFRPDEKGMDLAISAREVQMEGSGKYTEVFDIEFRKRTEGVDESLLDEAPSLDDLVWKSITPYSQVKKLFVSGETEDEEDSDDDESEGEEDEEEEDSEDGDEGGEEDDEDDQEDDDGDNGDDLDEPDPDAINVGDKVRFVYTGSSKKWAGKKVVGIVKSIKKGLAQVQSKVREEPFSVDVDELIPMESREEVRGRSTKKKSGKGKSSDEDDFDSDDDLEDFEDEPKKKSKKSAKGGAGKSGKAKGGRKEEEDEDIPF